MIRRHYLNLILSFTEWWLDCPCCMGWSASSQVLSCSKDACCGDEEVEMDMWAYLDRQS